jgi:hypothetical protein
MLFENSMSNVDESEEENKSLGEDFIVLDEFDEHEVEHNPLNSLGCKQDNTSHTRLLLGLLLVEYFLVYFFKFFKNFFKNIYNFKNILMSRFM